MPPKDKRYLVVYLLPFVILANDLLRCCWYSRFMAKVCPQPATQQNSLRIDSTSIYRLFRASGDNQFRIFDFRGEFIDSDIIVQSCKDAVFNSFFDRSSIERVCRSHRLNFAHNITILPGMKYVNTMVTKKNKSLVIPNTKKKELNNNIPWGDIRQRQLTDDATLRTEIDNIKQVINEAAQSLKRQALVIKNRDFGQAIINLK